MTIVSQGGDCHYWLCFDKASALALDEHLSAVDRWAKEIKANCATLPVATIEE